MEEKEHEGETVNHDHDYCIQPRSLEERYHSAHERIEELEKVLAQSSPPKFGLERFGSDPIPNNFYTGFRDVQMLNAVFCVLKLTAQTVIRWEQVQRKKGNDIELKESH